MPWLGARRAAGQAGKGGSSLGSWPARKIPPGLQRVAARLESLGVEGRSPGQTNALSQITRNLQRYVDTQALAPMPEPAPTPITDTAAPAASDDVDVTIATEVGRIADAGAQPATAPSSLVADSLPA